MQENDLTTDRLTDKLAAAAKKRHEERLRANERIYAGLAANGKQLRRNAMCPCGSRRKFKKCCLRDVKAQLDEKQYQIENPRIEIKTDAN